MVIELTGYNRSYASRVLRQRARPRVVGRPRKGGVNITVGKKGTGYFLARLFSREKLPVPFLVRIRGA